MHNGVSSHRINEMKSAMLQRKNTAGVLDKYDEDGFSRSMALFARLGGGLDPLRK